MTLRTISTSISISNIQESIIQFLCVSGFVHKDEEVVDLKFGGAMAATPTSRLNEYLQKTIPITYTVKKIETEKEVKIFSYGKKST